MSTSAQYIVYGIIVIVFITIAHLLTREKKKLKPHKWSVALIDEKGECAWTCDYCGQTSQIRPVINIVCNAYCTVR